MINAIRTGGLLAIATPFHHTDYDVVSKSTKTATTFADRLPETGKERLYAMYTAE